MTNESCVISLVASGVPIPSLDGYPAPIEPWIYRDTRLRARAPCLCIDFTELRLVASVWIDALAVGML